MIGAACYSVIAVGGGITCAVAMYRSLRLAAALLQDIQTRQWALSVAKGTMLGQMCKLQ
jgi:sulfite reductase beta subunit-like hemoprotein